MAEAELGDFFARKDKSKKKGKKSKFTTTNQIAQHVEIQVQAQTERENAVNAPAPMRPARRTKEDEDWEDFAEEHRPDLSGLKIASYSAREKAAADSAANPPEPEGLGADNVDSDEEADRAKEAASKPSCPGAAAAAGGKVWATADPEDSDEDVLATTTVTSTAAASTSAEPSTASATAPASADATPAAPGKYVPPSQRRAPGQPMDTSTVASTAAAAGKYIPPSQRRAMEAGASRPSGMSSTLQPMQMGARGGRGRNVAPDVNSDEAFPTLQAASSAPGTTAPAHRPAGFQDVHRGASVSYGQQRGAAGVSVENRYSNLR